jgi:hypothetical protein
MGLQQVDTRDVFTRQRSQTVSPQLRALAIGTLIQSCKEGQHGLLYCTWKQHWTDATDFIFDEHTSTGWRGWCNTCESEHRPLAKQRRIVRDQLGELTREEQRLTAEIENLRAKADPAAIARMDELDAMEDGDE